MSSRRTLKGQPDRIRGLNLNLPAARVRVDRTVEQAGAGDYDGLLVPGGFINPDLLRQSASARGLVREFVQSGKPVVTLCHGPWVLASAGVLQGRTLTSWAGIRDDVVNAGATWLDQEVVRDGNLTTSRGPQDMAAFIPAMLDTFAAGPLTATPSGTTSCVRPAAEQPAEPRGGSDAMVAEAVDRSLGRGRPCCAGEPDRPAPAHAVARRLWGRLWPGGEVRDPRLTSRRGPRDRSPAAPRARRRRRRPGRPA